MDEVLAEADFERGSLPVLIYLLPLILIWPLIIWLLGNHSDTLMRTFRRKKTHTV